MAGAPIRKVSAASARAHTRRSDKKSFKFPSGLILKLVAVSFVGVLAWAFKAIQPPPPNIPGSPAGPPVTAPRIKLRDGRHLAYKEHGVPKDMAKFKVVFIHAFHGSRHHVITPSQEVMDDLAIYMVSFDRPGYGQSDPDPKRTAKSIALDVEELADKLELGPKFYLLGYSMGGQIAWSCLKHIPHRLAGAALLAPVINYWWPNIPSHLSTEAFSQRHPWDQWEHRVAHYAPWLYYWWKTQKLFPSSVHPIQNFSPSDRELFAKLSVLMDYQGEATLQGEFESIHRDLLIGFSTTEFDPLDLEDPIPDTQGSVYVWQGEEDMLVPVAVQRYIVRNLPWIRYHEIPGAGHLFPHVDGMTDTIFKALLVGETAAQSP